MRPRKKPFISLSLTSPIRQQMGHYGTVSSLILLSPKYKRAPPVIMELKDTLLLSLETLPQQLGKRSVIAMDTRSGDACLQSHEAHYQSFSNWMVLTPLLPESPIVFEYLLQHILRVVSPLVRFMITIDRETSETNERPESLRARLYPPSILKSIAGMASMYPLRCYGHQLPILDTVFIQLPAIALRGLVLPYTTSSI